MNAVGLTGGPGRASGLTSSGNTAAFRAALWTNMEKLADVIYSSYSQVGSFPIARDFLTFPFGAVVID